MSRRLFDNALEYLRPKSPDQNFVAAAFYMVTISLISMSMVHMNWFIISAPLCLPYIALSDYFWLYSTEDMTDVCLTNSTVNMIRIIILLCFMAVIFSLAGFFLEIMGTKSSIPDFIRIYSIPSSCTVLWIMAIIATCYYVGVELEDNISKQIVGPDVYVSYGTGLYVITATGGIALLGTFCTLILTFARGSQEWQSDHSQLIDDNSDILEAFRIRPPPPPYSIPPPPPYTP